MCPKCLRLHVRCAQSNYKQNRLQASYKLLSRVKCILPKAIFNHLRYLCDKEDYFLSKRIREQHQLIGQITYDWGSRPWGPDLFSRGANFLSSFAVSWGHVFHMPSIAAEEPEDTRALVFKLQLLSSLFSISCRQDKFRVRLLISRTGNPFQTKCDPC